MSWKYLQNKELGSAFANVSIGAHSEWHVLHTINYGASFQYHVCFKCSQMCENALPFEMCQYQSIWLLYYFLNGQHYIGVPLRWILNLECQGRLSKIRPYYRYNGRACTGKTWSLSETPTGNIKHRAIYRYLINSTAAIEVLCQVVLSMPLKCRIYKGLGTKWGCFSPLTYRDLFQC